MNLSDASRDAETLGAEAKANALVVRRDDLATAHDKARRVSRRLHRIEDPLRPRLGRDERSLPRDSPGRDAAAGNARSRPGPSG